MGNDLTKSKYYIQLYNLFGSLGGLNAILERIDGEVGESKDDVQTIDNKPVSPIRFLCFNIHKFRPSLL